MGGRGPRHPHTPLPSFSTSPSWRQPALLELIHGARFSVQNERRGYSYCPLSLSCPLGPHWPAHLLGAWHRGSESVGSRSVEGSRSLLHLTPPTSWKLAGVRPWGVSLLSLVRKANFSLEKETSVPPVEHLCPLHGSQLCSLKWGHVVNVQFHGPSR